jgi:hypothetical protein
LLAGALALTAVALAACYSSDRLLLDPAQAATPLATGEQTTAGGPDKRQTVQISLEPDRWYLLRDPDSQQGDLRLLFNPMAGGAAGEQRYAFAYAVGGKGKGVFLYGVATRRGGAVYFDTPSCDQPEALKAAQAHGVSPPATRGALSPVCTFTDAGSLMGALKDYAEVTNSGRDLPHLPAGG